MNISLNYFVEFLNVEIPNKLNYTLPMTFLTTLLIFALCFLGMALGLFISKKVLKKGCSMDPTDPKSTCACETGEGEKCK